MADPKQTLDLSALKTDYDLVGELSGRGGTRAYIATTRDPGAKRREDDTRVLISVFSSPAGDEGNALSHLAADTKLLAGLKHRRLIPVVEGRWIGKDAYAIVTQRTTDASLAEKLAGGESFSTPRTAAILREVNGLIEWAREHNVVHRSVTADGIFLEPKTDRVRISFSATPIARIQRSDLAEDARTIARLAIAMLTGNADAETDEVTSINELRPELPARLGEATTALLHDASTATSADVATYIALIGMADPLYAGETEAERIRQEVLEEQRVEREKLANERAASEQLIIDERARFDQQMSDERAAFEQAMADERARVEGIMTVDRDQLAAEKAELQRVATQERAELVALRRELERADVERRAQIEAVAANDRLRIEKLRADLMAAGEFEIEKKRSSALEDLTDDASTLEEPELVSPVFIPLVASPLQELEFDDDTPLMRADAPPELPSLEAPLPVQPDGAQNASTDARPSWRKWLIPAGVGAALIVLAVAGIALTNRTPAAPVPVVKTAPVVAVTPPPVAAIPPSVVPLPDAPAIVDSAAERVALDSLRRVEEARAELRRARAARAARARRDSIPLDSVFQIPRRDTLARRDSIRRDSLPPQSR